MGVPGGAIVKKSTCSAGDARDASSVAESGRSPGEGNGTPLQCSCLENPWDGGDWWATVCGVAQSRTRLKRLSSSSSQYSFLEKPMNKGTWRATVCGVARVRHT